MVFYGVLNVFKFHPQDLEYLSSLQKANTLVFKCFKMQFKQKRAGKSTMMLSQTSSNIKLNLSQLSQCIRTVQYLDIAPIL